MLEQATGSLAVIILNYKRPQNIGRIITAVRQALPQAPIFILDQAEQDGLTQRDDIPWSEVWYQRAAVNGGAGARFALACRLPFDLYLAIDDDIFLTPPQIGTLAERLRAEPDRAHGIGGQRVEFDGKALSLTESLERFTGQVSILNGVYAFRRRQAKAAIELSARLGYPSWREIGPIDDILLSCAAAKPSMCHDFRDIARCETSNQAGIAVWRDGDFEGRRTDVIRKLLAIKSIAVFSPLTIRDPAS